MKLMIFAAALAVLATPAIAQEEWINRDCAKYSASLGTRTRGIKPGAVSPYILEKLRQKDAPKIKAARQECEWRKQEQIEAKAAREEAERQANIKAARREALRKEAEQKAIAEKAEHDRKDAEARVAMCYGAVPIDKAHELANAAINDVRAKMDLTSPPVDQLVADRLRYLIGQRLNAETDDKRMPGFTKLTETKQAAAVVVACYDGVRQLMKDQMRAIKDAKRVEPAAPTPAKPLAATAAHAEGDVVVSTPVQACAKVTTECRELAVGTVVVEQNYWGNTSCVLPAGAAPPCLWVNVNALTYPKGYQPVRMTQEQLDKNQRERRYAGDPPIPGEPLGGRLQIQFQRGANSGNYLRELVSMRNTTGIDFASVRWNCKFYDKDDYKVGEGAAIFYLVRKQSVTFDTMTFPLNIGIGLVKKVNCELIGVEKVTKENARMYSPGRNWGTDGLRSRFWQGQYEPQGEAGASDFPAD